MNLFNLIGYFIIYYIYIDFYKIQNNDIFYIDKIKTYKEFYKNESNYYYFDLNFFKNQNSMTENR